MSDRRLVGIDLGITSAHTVHVLDGEGTALAKRKAWPTLESLRELEATALQGTAPGVVLEVVMEPTGPAWLPIAVYFAARGHRVFRVSSQKAADLRRFLKRHTKTNAIDAETLAKLPIFDPDGLVPLELPTAERAALDRRVRACDRLTADGAARKVRIKDLVRQLMPMSPLTGDLGAADLAVLEAYADPKTLVAAGLERLSALIAEASNNHLGAERARQWLHAAEAALALYAGHHAVAFGDLAAEVAAYLLVDPQGLARSLPGLKRVGGPTLVACMGDPARFRHGKQFRSFTGLVPKASETGETDRKGQAMSKAGSSLLRTTMFRAADFARKQDPQLARLYYVQMVERGKGHLGALCVVAAALAERSWRVMRRGAPYVVRDVDGRPVDASEAKAIIAEHYSVPAEVRARRRSKKDGGKVPKKVLTGQSKPRTRGAGMRGGPPPGASSALAS